MLLLTIALNLLDLEMHPALSFVLNYLTIACERKEYIVMKSKRSYRENRAISLVDKSLAVVLYLIGSFHERIDILLKDNFVDKESLNENMTNINYIYFIYITVNNNRFCPILRYHIKTYLLHFS